MIKEVDISEYREDIITLWHNCFGDNSEYISFFLDNCPEKSCIGYVDSGKLVSMLFLLSGKINDFSCKYIYAACTDSAYRKKGIMGSLINFTFELCRQNEIDSVFLVPGNASLYNYYDKFGFVSCFYRDEIEIKDIKSLVELTTESDYKTVALTRNGLLNKIDSFRFTDDITEYIIKENEFTGNYSECLCCEDENSVMFYSFKDNELNLREFLSDKGMNSSALYTLCKKYDAQNIYIRCPIVYNSKNNEIKHTKCGMLYAINPQLKKIIDDGIVFYAGMYLD